MRATSWMISSCRSVPVNSPRASSSISARRAGREDQSWSRAAMACRWSGSMNGPRALHLVHGLRGRLALPGVAGGHEIALRILLVAGEEAALAALKLDAGAALRAIDAVEGVAPRAALERFRITPRRLPIPLQRGRFRLLHGPPPPSCRRRTVEPG